MNHHLFNKDTLNIFTDGSIKKFYINGEEETIGCAGANVVITDESGINYVEAATEITRNTTNNDTEIRSILLGVQRALYYRELYPFKYINIIADSKICIYGLREWVFNWINNTDPNTKVMISSQGTPVANQQVILQIIYMILQNNLVVNFYHQNGHKNCNNMKDMLTAKDTFIRSNYIGCDVDMELIRNISRANDYVDRFTKQELEHFVPDRIIRPNEYIHYVYRPFDYKKYNELIGGFNKNDC